MAVGILLQSLEGKKLAGVIGGAAGIGGLALKVLARTETSEDLQAAVTKLQPEVVIIDAATPGIDVLQSCRQLIAQQNDIRIVVLVVGPDDRTLIRALTSGASGILRKTPTAGDMHDCIQTIMRNRIYIGPLQSPDAQAPKPSSSTKRKGLEVLSDREIEVLTLLSNGAKTREIAASLHISEKTVETHRGHIMQKLDIHSVAGLTKFAIKHQLTTSDNQ